MEPEKANGPDHKELHTHVNPHLHPDEIEKGAYSPSLVNIGDKPLKSRWRLDWIYTKIRIGKLHPFPLFTILLLGIPMVWMILLAVGVPMPFSFTQLPLLKALFNYVGIYSDADLFVSSTWVYWWPIFIVAILVFKRIWCGGFCPFGLMTDIGNFFGKKLRSGRQPKPINITKYIFIGFFVFKALGYLHDAIGITNSVVLSVEFVIFFIVYSFIIGMIAPRRTFCRVFCFLGALPHLFGRLSLYTLETDRSKCAKCEGQWCLTGHQAPPKGIATAREPLINLDGCPMYINIPQLSHKESNRNCILCGNCIKNCPYDAIHYKPKVPGYELYKGIDLNMHETVFVLGLIPLLGMFIAMESGALMDFAMFFRFGMEYHWAITGLYYLLAIITFVFVYYVAAGLGALALGVDRKLALRNFGYIFLPFAYMAMIRDIVLTYFLKGSFIPTQFPDVVIAYPFIDITLILIGAAWSIYMAVRIGQVTLQQAGKEPDPGGVGTNTLLQMVVVAWLTYFWIGSMFGDNAGTLAYYDIHFTVPFVAAGGLILLFTLVARYHTVLKAALGLSREGEE